ncbi:MAG TPA: FAD-dependent oxidoreductase, partial [Candidatus Methylomirabilis sp.]|nr:FAD-dependent oxidoreductase [Candidatus Methylomirabilis sp.]
GMAAARLGAKTLIVERSGDLGGNAATGMNLGGFFDGDDVQVVRGIPQEFVDRAVEFRSGRGHIFFHDVDRWISSTASIDPEGFKSIALEKVQAAGCHLWLYTTFARAIAQGNCVQAVEVVTKSGVSRLAAKVFVDASGDADLAASVGIPFERGGGARQQAVTSIFRVGQVDQGAVESFMQKKINTEGKTPWTFENAPLRTSHRYWTPWKIFPDYAERFPRQFGVYYHGVPGEIFLNCNHTALALLDPDEITRSTIRLRQQALEILDFLQRCVPGFGRSSLTQVYDLGVRESRRIVGDYTLTVEDMVTRREFEDVVAMGAYPPDLHDAHGGEILISARGWSRVHVETGIPNNPGYQIPLR